MLLLRKKTSIGLIWLVNVVVVVVLSFRNCADGKMSII